MNKSIYHGKKVLVTGHTGFKGSWLIKCLEMFGAEVVGYALPPENEKDHYNLIQCEHKHIVGDVRDYDSLSKVVSQEKPHIIFHLAAQALLRRSYSAPIETYETNIMGTLNLFEAARQANIETRIVNVTTDKCYKNKEQDKAYKETDELGGYDPYSSSKACSEILSESYRSSYFPVDAFGKSHNVLLATARSGNVIGGGDWSEDRIVPDIMKSIQNDHMIELRNPESIRPWQHVLEPIFGYLQLGGKLLENQSIFADAWNFGPDPKTKRSVQDLAKQLYSQFDKDFHLKTTPSSLHEAHLLILDSSKAIEHISWENLWNFQDSVEQTAQWYIDYLGEQKVSTEKQINAYLLGLEHDNK